MDSIDRADWKGNGNVPVQIGEQGVTMVSGFSPVIFRFAVEGKQPEQLMLDTVK